VVACIGAAAPATWCATISTSVAFAAGHRPCAECRRKDYNTYRTLWFETHSGAMPHAKDMDAQLHRERTSPAEHRASWEGLPDGVFVATDCGPAVVVGDHLAVWDQHDGIYREKPPRPGTGIARVLTPPSIVQILRAGYPVQIDDSAG
jgi:hypothetical protein